MALYRDNADAWSLIPLLSSSIDQDWMILGLARGGVPIAARIAEALGARIGALILLKVGAPGTWNSRSLWSWGPLPNG